MPHAVDPRWRPTPRLGGLLALCLLGYGLATQSQTGWLYLGLAALGGAVPVALLYPPLAVRGLRASARVVSPRVPPVEGQTIVVEVTVANPTPLPRYWLELVDCSGLTLESGQAARACVAVLPARGTVVVPWTVTCRRRGVFVWPSLRAATTAPFGLARAEARLAGDGLEVCVYPRWWPLRGATAGGAAQDGARPARRRAQGTDVFGTRPYRTGDNLRWIHWRSTARRGDLVVREFEDLALPSLTLVLDAGTETGASPSFDVAVRLAASAARWALDRGYTVRLLSNSAAPRAPTADLSWSRLGAYLARVEPARGLPSIAGLLAAVAPGGPVLVILPRLTAAVVPPLLELRRRATTLAVAVDTGGEGDAQPFARALEEGGAQVVPFGAADEVVDVTPC
jgi:uncharacterized protein (DUF58 family)